MAIILYFIFVFGYNYRMKKLSEADRSEIIRRSQAGETQQNLADAYNVAQSTINRVVNKAKEAQREAVVDPNPAITTETLQKRYWAKYTRLAQVVDKRQEFLRTDPTYLEDQIRTWDNKAKKASTPQLEDSYRHRADSYRLELASLNDLGEFNDEMLELLRELKMLAEVLVKVRGDGMGKERVDWL